MTSLEFLSYLKTKACIFWDWNGTLLDDLDYSLSVNNQIFKSKSIAALSKQFYQDNFTLPISKYYDKLDLERLGISRDEMTDLFAVNYKANHHKPKLHNGAEDCLRHLYEAKVIQVLFSAAHITELEFQIKHHDISNYFKVLSGAKDFNGGSKLHRGRAIKEKHNFIKGVVVGDTLHDLQIGREIGFETVWVSKGHQSIQRAKGKNFIDYIFDRSKEEFYKNP